MISPIGVLSHARLGPDPKRGESPQVVVAAGLWFAASRDAGSSPPHGDAQSRSRGAAGGAPGIGMAGYTLVGCTTAPGFEFADWELADRSTLLSQLPQHREVITRLTRA
jgi:predicted cupin superfamily sugar epimerase